jgi:hypothetical protein
MCDYCFYHMLYGVLKDIVTFIIAAVAASGAFMAAFTYNNNRKMKQFELIHKMYEDFLTDKKYAFYELIKSNAPFALDDNNEKMLNEFLTYFDELEYQLSLGLINKKTIIYFASEILNFHNNKTVKDYILSNKNKYDINFRDIDKRIRKEIIPFSGFTALVEKIEKMSAL